MDVPKACPSPDAAAARLLVHAENVDSGSAFELALHRLRSRCASRARRAAAAALGLQLYDLQGRRLADIREAGALTAFGLPPGTYVLTAVWGPVRRSYTLALEAGATVELHLHLGGKGAAMSVDMHGATGCNMQDHCSPHHGGTSRSKGVLP